MEQQTGSKLGKEYDKTVYCHPAYLAYIQSIKRLRASNLWSSLSFNLFAEYIMRNTGLEEAQAAIKIARRNISNLRYADDTTLTAESNEELKSLLMK